MSNTVLFIDKRVIMSKMYNFCRMSIYDKPLTNWGKFFSTLQICCLKHRVFHYFKFVLSFFYLFISMWW
jgi:hypothetical protein